MNLKKIEFEIISVKNSFVAWMIFTIIVLMMGVSGFSFEGTLVSTVALMICALFIGRTSTIRTQWVLDKDGVWINYLSGGSFVQMPDHGWSWNDIEYFELFDDRSYRGFKFTFTNGTSKKYYVKYGKSEGYDTFIAAFESQFNKIKLKRSTKNVTADNPNAYND